MKKKRRFIWVLLSLFWIGFIFYNSSQNYAESNERSRKVVSEIKERNIGPQKNIKLGQRSNFIIRKVAHAFEYFVLAMLLSKTFFALGVRGRYALGYILFMVILCAVLDEYYQLFVQGSSNLKSRQAGLSETPPGEGVVSRYKQLA